ncbi:MAG TPA: tyrosine-type recombinase/integrase [Bacilli bacterium]
MRVEPIRKIADIERIEHVLRFYSYRDWLTFKFGINTALRIGDVLKLKVWQVKERYLSLNEQKTKKLRRFYINSSLRPILTDYVKYMDDEDYLFRPIIRNKYPTNGQFYRSISTAARICGIENIGTHSCRKTFGYHFYRKTKDIAMLMEILNHASERETLIYIGMMQDEIDQSMESFFL